MNLFFPVQSPASPSADATGHWLLQTGRAITLLPAAGGHLNVANGELWATLSDARSAWPRLTPQARLERCATFKDYFLHAGESMAVPPGARVVIESTGRSQTTPTAFAWSPSITHAKQPAQPRRAGVVQASSELAQALAQVARALRHLAAALLVPPQRDTGAARSPCL